MNMLLDALDVGFMKQTDGWLTAIFFTSLRSAMTCASAPVPRSYTTMSYGGDSDELKACKQVWQK